MEIKHLTKMMDRDRYLRPKEAKELALLDQVIEDRKNKAKGQ